MQTNNLIIYRENGRVYNYNLLPLVKSNQCNVSFYINYRRSTSNLFTLTGDFCGYVTQIQPRHIYGLEDGCIEEIVVNENKSVWFGTYKKPFLYNYYDGCGLPYHLN